MKRIGDVLVERNVCTNDQIEEALKSKKDGERIGDVLIRLNVCTESQIMSALEVTLDIQRVSLASISIKEEVSKLVNEEFAKRAVVMPYKIDGKKLYYATSDPLDFHIQEDIRMQTGLRPRPSLATKKEILDKIEKHYGYKKALNLLGIKKDDFSEDSKKSRKNLMDADKSMPIVQIVNLIISQAVKRRASDIHIDPLDNMISIRYRIDGELINVDNFPLKLHPQIVSRVKVMAKLNITEKRLPQDGRLRETIADRDIDLRISTLPTVRGEKIVMRILDLSNSFLDLAQLNFNSEEEEVIKRMIAKTTGIVLVTGPTGSGKTSTLYSFLNVLNQPNVNIITIEDPVEIRMEGINQVQVKSDIDFTFASALRSILRQDPNVIMVGEIRDVETASIAVRASLTGHFVLSTIHTNSTFKTISRLIDMGVEPFLLASSLSGIIAQRLVRKICPYCATSRDATEEELSILKKYGTNITTVKYGTGCSECNEVGFLGREAVFEILEVTDHIVDLIVNEASAKQIEEAAIKNGTNNLFRAGIKKVELGITTMDELLRVISE